MVAPLAPARCGNPPEPDRDPRGHAEHPLAHIPNGAEVETDLGLHQSTSLAVLFRGESEPKPWQVFVEGETIRACTED